MGVDKYWRVYFSDEVKEWKVEHLSTVLYHEILHLLRKHASRAEMMNAHKRVWNIAGDCEINDDLEEEGLKFPHEMVTPSKFGYKNGLLTEAYYNKLLDDATVVEVGGVGDGNCGSCASGGQEEWEKGGGGEDGAVSEIEAEVIRQGVAKAVQEYKKSRGTVPTHLDRWSGEFLSPAKIPWQRELAAHIKKSLSTMAGRVDYTYTKPSRRQSAFGKVVMPSMRQPSPKVGVVIDTSGSMGAQDLEDALSEVKGILMSVGQRNGVEVMSVDAAVHTAQKVFSVRQVKVVGGGGTDMREGLRAMAEKRLGVVVVLTDGYTPWPETKPPFDVIIGLIGGRVDTPHWAKTVVVE
jgi:predicted metal-dependent peptidase